MAGILGAVNLLTEEDIAQAKKIRKQAAIKQVLPPFDKLEEAKIAVEVVQGKNTFKKEQLADSLIIYNAYKEERWIGAAVETFTDKGFSGRIKLLAGFLPNGDIYKIEVLEHAETPGLGDKIETGKSKFPRQFIGKNPKAFRLIVDKDGGDVDAITAATISSRAYSDAVQTAYTAFMKNGGKINE